MKIENPFKGDIPYDKHWGIVDYNGKVILDIGADIGSTATFFLERGATKVIAVEGNRDLYAKLEENAKLEPRIKPVYRMMSSQEDFFYLLGLAPDVVKIDCEYGETHLLGVAPEQIRKAKEYMIECHSAEIFRNILKKMGSCGFNASVFMFDPEVIYAVRRD